MSAEEPSALVLILRRDRVIGLVALLLFIALAWWYLLDGAGRLDGMSSMSGMDANMGMTGPWTPGYAWIVFVMWWVMMIAMMLPSAAPMILLHGLVSRHQGKTRGSTPISSGIFLLGYLTVWGVFSALATTMQWQLQAVTLMSPAMAITNAVAGGLILIAAGLYQLTPFRDACLQHCRGPMEFVSRHWVPGAAGAWKMGIRHGLYCLGCCWMLMLLLFYGGVMNLYWIIGLSAYVLVEKFAPAGLRLDRLASALLIVWGMVVLLGILG